MIEYDRDFGDEDDYEGFLDEEDYEDFIIDPEYWEDEEDDDKEDEDNLGGVLVPA